MKTHIEIDIEDNKMTICEKHCAKETYSISDNWPIIIDDICRYLHDTIEGLG